MSEDFFHVFGEIRVEYRCLAGFFFVSFGKTDTLGKGAAHRLGGMKHGHGPRIVLDHDLRAFAHAVEQGGEVARRFRVGNVDDVLCYGLIIQGLPERDGLISTTEADL